MERLSMMQEIGGEIHWIPILLTGVFLIHTGAFIYLYIKRRHFYTKLLMIAFPFLVVYYLLESLQVEFLGMIWLRWIGIAIATIATGFFFRDLINKKRKKTNRAQADH
jgi:hypothetical protein